MLTYGGLCTDWSSEEGSANGLAWFEVIGVVAGFP